MITCREFIEFLADYLSAELPKEQIARFEEHLSMCPSCVAYLHNYRQSIDLARCVLRPTGEPVPDEIPDALVQAILAARISA